MQSSTSEMLKQLGLGIVGQALPKMSVLQTILSDVRKALLATVVTGVLASSLILIGCFAFYHFLLLEGISFGATIAISSVLLLCITIISALVAEKYLSKASHAKEKLSVMPTEQKDSQASCANIEILLQAFVDGFREKEESVNHAGSTEEGSDDMSKKGIISTDT